MDFGVPVLQQRSHGKGAAIREAMERIRAFGIPFVVVLDADATYPGESILPAFELLRCGSDLVIGVRKPKKAAAVSPGLARDLVHHVGNALLNVSAEFLSGCSLLDICSGFWAARVAGVEELQLRSTDFAVEAELFLKARRRGWRVVQFPIEYKDRVGEAKLNGVRDGLRILGAILRFGRESPGVVGDPVSRRLSRSLRALMSMLLSEGPHKEGVDSAKDAQAAARDLAARMRRERLARLWRALTLVLLIEGPRDVVLMATPEMQSDAQTIAASLRKSSLATGVSIEPGRPDDLGRRPSGIGAGIPAVPSSMILGQWDHWDPFHPAGLQGKYPVAVRFSHKQPGIFVDLASEPLDLPEGAENPWAKSGAFRETPDRDQPRFVRTIHFLADQLRSAPNTSSLLSANGIRVETLGLSGAQRYPTGPWSPPTPVPGLTLSRPQRGRRLLPTQLDPVVLADSTDAAPLHHGS